MSKNSKATIIFITYTQCIYMLANNNQEGKAIGLKGGGLDVVLVGHQLDL